jgi:hypothetical protein
MHNIGHLKMHQVLALGFGQKTKIKNKEKYWPEQAVNARSMELAEASWMRI